MTKWMKADTLSVCPRSKRKTAWAIKTKSVDIHVYSMAGPRCTLTLRSKGQKSRAHGYQVCSRRWSIQVDTTVHFSSLKFSVIAKSYSRPFGGNAQRISHLFSVRSEHTGYTEALTTFPVMAITWRSCRGREWYDIFSASRHDWRHVSITSLCDVIEPSSCNHAASQVQYHCVVS